MNDNILTNIVQEPLDAQEELLLVRYLSACRCHCIRTATIHLQRLAAMREDKHGVARRLSYRQYLVQAGEKERKEITKLLVSRNEYEFE